MEFTVRDFRHADFEILWSIDQQCFAPGTSYSRAELATYLRRPGAFALVAESPEVSQVAAPNRVRFVSKPSADILGFVLAEALNRSSGHIITIDVRSTARGVGVGSTLLRFAEDRLRAAHCHTVILEAAVDNQTALSFYKTHEYHVVKTIPRYYSGGVDALVLKKDLLSSAGPAKLPQ